MPREFRADDWQAYRMDYGNPHERVEPIEQEIAIVDAALAELVDAGVLPHADYPADKMLAHRQGVAEAFEIPWTAITHRQQRLIYAINAIIQPRNMIAAGVFCGNTFISNAGAGVGPGEGTLQGGLDRQRRFDAGAIHGLVKDQLDGRLDGLFLTGRGPPGGRDAWPGSRGRSGSRC